VGQPKGPARYQTCLIPNPHLILRFQYQHLTSNGLAPCSASTNDGTKSAALRTKRLAVFAKHFVAVPGEVGGVGAEGGLGREGEGAVVEVGELEVASAGEDGFGDVGLGDLDAQVVVDGPEAGVEEIVCYQPTGSGPV